MELAENALTKPENLPDHLIIQLEKYSELERLINVATEKIENYCNREFKKDTRTEKYEGKYSNWLMLKNWPVHEVEWIKYHGEEIDDYEVNENGQIFRSSSWKKSGADQKYNIEVKYEAGFILPGEENRDLPVQIEQACILLVKNLLQRMQRDFDVQRKNLPDISETYFGPDDQEELPTPIKSLLSDYKRQLV